MTETTKRSVVLRGRRTAVSLEGPFWKELRRMAWAREMSMNELIADFDESRRIRRKTGQLSNALRVFVFEWVQSQTGDRTAPVESSPHVETLQ